MKKRNRRFILGDLHGNFKGFKQVLEQSGLDYQNDTLISLGDIVDGYPHSFECVEKLLKIKNLIPLRGNHDWSVLEFLETGEHPYNWMSDGLSTLKSYADNVKRDIQITTRIGGYSTNLDFDDIPATHIEFFRSQLPYYKDEKGNIFVHGGFDRTKKLNEQDDESIFWWDRKLFTQAMSVKEKDKGSWNFALKIAEENVNRIFIGHTPTLNYKINGKDNDLPIIADRVVNLDTGGGYENGRVTIMDVDTLEFWQSDLGKDLYPEGGRGSEDKYKKRKLKKY